MHCIVSIQYKKCAVQHCNVFVTVKKKKSVLVVNKLELLESLG